MNYSNRVNMTDITTVKCGQWLQNMYHPTFTATKSQVIYAVAVS